MENLQKDFIPYGLALKMKQLGFDEPCLKSYGDDGLLNQNDHSLYLSAPLYQQAFRWFRHKNYKTSICFDIDVNTGETLYGYEIFEDKQFMFETDFIYREYEEAEQACLEKLLEIVGQKKK